MLPEWTRFNVVDESNGGKIHVCLAVILDNQGFGNIASLGRASNGTFKRHGVIVVNRPGQLCRTKYVWHKGVVVQTPHAVGACGLQCICSDELSNKRQVSVRSQYGSSGLGSEDLRFNNGKDNFSFNVNLWLVRFEMTQFP